MGEVLRLKSPTHKKGKYLPKDICRIKGLVSTINKATDLIRTLLHGEFETAADEQEIKDHLWVLFDRMLRMGFYTIPSFDKSALEKWSQLTAAEELKCLNQYLERRKTDLMSQERDASWKLFMDPRKRKIWFQNAYGLQNSGCPNFAIDWKG